MADRGSHDTPLAPRRTLGPTEDEQVAKRPFGERMSAALSSAGTAVSSAAASRTSSAGRTGAAAAAPPDRAATRPRTRTRKARLRMTHLDPWSVMKVSFLLSIAFGVVTVVAVAVVWSVLGAAGVWDSINQTVGDVVGGDTASSFDVKDYVGTSRVMGFTMIVAVVDVVLITAVATLAAFLYNLSAALLGGLEVTLAEDDS